MRGAKLTTGDIFSVYVVLFELFIGRIHSCGITLVLLNEIMAYDEAK